MSNTPNAPRTYRRQANHREPALRAAVSKVVALEVGQGFWEGTAKDLSNAMARHNCDGYTTRHLGTTLALWYAQFEPRIGRRILDGVTVWRLPVPLDLRHIAKVDALDPVRLAIRKAVQKIPGNVWEGTIVDLQRRIFETPAARNLTPRVTHDQLRDTLRMLRREGVTSKFDQDDNIRWFIPTSL